MATAEMTPRQLAGFAIGESQTAFNEAIQHLNVVRLALLDVNEAMRQAEEKHAAVQVDLAAVNHVAQCACLELGISDLDALIPTIRALKAERDQLKAERNSGGQR